MTMQHISAYGISPAGRVAASEERIGLKHATVFDAVRRAAAFSLVAYLPFLGVTLLERLRVGHWPPSAMAIDTHVRALVALPTLLIAEHVIDVSARGATAYLVKSGIVHGDGLVRYHAITRQLSRLRDSLLVEFILFAIALGTAALHVRPVVGMTDPVYGLGTMIMLTLFRFVLLRWIWSWSLWTLFLARVSRLPLALTATHPDQMGGLGVLLAPSKTFALVAAGGSAAIASSWANRVLFANVPVSTFKPAALVYAGTMLVIAAAPLLFFSGTLYRVRKQGLVYYGAFVQHFGTAFEEWTRGRRLGPSSVDAPEICSMTDLGTTYERAAAMKTVLWSRRLVLNIVVGSVGPMLPLLLVEKNVPDLLVDLLKALM